MRKELLRARVPASVGAPGYKPTLAKPPEAGWVLELLGPSVVARPELLVAERRGRLCGQGHCGDPRMVGFIESVEAQEIDDIRALVAWVPVRD